jgi:hypothetical protein
MKAQRLTVSMVLCALLLLTAQPIFAAESMLLGVYYGNQGWKMDQVQAMESWQGKRHAVVNMFTNWNSTSKTISNVFSQQLPNIWNNGNVPLVTWEPTTGASTLPDIEVRIARGEYDTYINTWASQMKTFLSGPDGVFGSEDDRRAYLRLAHEMNGDWYPWGSTLGNNSPADYVAMWRHVKAIFASKGITSTHLQWMWCVNHDDVGTGVAEQFFPGNDHVDWVAIDGYNWGTSQTWSSWKSPANTYDPMITRLRAISSKPLAITEFASTSSGNGVSGKSQWISDAFSYFVSKNVKMVVWFNEDKETDWGVFGGVNGDGTFKYGRTSYKTYASYKSAVNAHTIAPDKSNPRLLTDAQFAGP